MSTYIEIKVPISVVKRKKYWIAYCPILKTYGYSSISKAFALKDFDDAAKTFFHVQETLGTLNQTLLSLGWTRVEKDKKVNVEAPKYFNADLPPYRTPTQTERAIRVPAYS